MAIPCNGTSLEAQTQINSIMFHLVKWVNMCVSCSLHTVLIVPLLVAILSHPSLLRHTRFLLLTHLLLCDTLQQLLSTIRALLLWSNEDLPVTQCLMFCAAIQACSLVDLLLCTALAVDRFVAVKWPLRYESLMCTQRKRATVASIWTGSAILTGVALAISLHMIHYDLLLSRCRPHVLAPCISGTSALFVFCTVVTAVVVPLCCLTILACFCLLCWDIRRGLLSSKRACVTLTLQLAQTLFISVPLVMESYLIPGYLLSDSVDIAANVTYNLGMSLIPLVYGYRSRELQQRIRQFAQRSKVNHQSQF